MKNTRPLFIVSFLFVCLFYSCGSSQPDNANATADTNKTTVTDTTPTKAKGIDLSAYNRRHNDVAQILAGLNPTDDNTVKAVAQTQAWKNYASEVNSFFDNFKTKRLPLMQDFANSELAGVNQNFETLLYPYSGPDFGHAHIFFPNARQIIMFGLEPVGTMPEVDKLSEKDMATFLAAMQQALKPIFHESSYFMTNDMGHDFSGTPIDVNGVTPIFYRLLAQFGYQTLDMRRITIDAQGNIVDSIAGKTFVDKAKDRYIAGVEFIYYKQGDDFTRTLRYFSHDVSDDNLTYTPEFITFIEQQNITASYYKAASYLGRWFSKVRNASLNKSKYIFQDDSGIPIRFFATDKWTFKLYGTYQRTLKTFADAFQPDLKKMYDTTQAVPLKFGIGYNNNFNQPNLMLATKK